MIARAATQDLQWLVDRVGCALTPAARAIGAYDGGRIRGMVAYDVWTENGVQCHMAVDTPAAWRTLIPAVFRYPFLEAGKGVLLAVVRSKNTRSLSTCERLGLEVVGRVRDGFAVGDDLVLLEMRRERCEWLNGWRRSQRLKEAA